MATRLCFGEETIEGHAACDGPDVQAVNFKAPGSNDWWATEWCADCRAVAEGNGYEIEFITDASSSLTHTPATRD